MDGQVDADEMAALCYARFQALPRTGKPEAGREWTPLAAVLQLKRTAPGHTVKEVVSLGTGSKCIARTSMSLSGDVINDSHAEVIARRGCVRYLLEQLHRSVSGRGSEVLERLVGPDEVRFRLRPEVSFVFFTSHTPCGDASIIPKCNEAAPPCRPPGRSLKRRASEEADGHSPKLPRPHQHGTGHKRVQGGTSDPHGTGHERVQGGTSDPLGTGAERVQGGTSDPHGAGHERGQGGTSDPLGTGAERVQGGTSDPHGTGAERLQGGTSDPLGTGAERVQGGTSDPHGTGAERVQGGTALGHSGDVHRTGAKCVPGGPSDPLLPGAGYHHTGLLRLKPGRGEPTLSLSCSDKLARWCVLGLQGALLSHYLCEAIYFSTVVVGKCAYSEETMRRAVLGRCSQVSGLPNGFSVTSPVFLQSSLEFPFSQTQTEQQHRAGRGRVSPCGAAISWCKVSEKPLDVTANGYKHGVTKKALGTAKARSLLCKRSLLETFLRVMDATPSSELPLSLRSPGLCTYWDYKAASAVYQQAWAHVRREAFPLWPRSDRALLLFSAP